MNRLERSLHIRTITLIDKVVGLARDIESRFGKEDDRTIFARNAYCELQEVANQIEGTKGALLK